MELQGTIGTTLEYFLELEHATRPHNHPRESLVLQTDFFYMVERVDICIEFLKSHVRFIFLRSPPVGVAHALEIAQLKRSGSIPLAFPATYDPRDDTHQIFFVGSLLALTQDVSQRLFEQVRYGDVHVFITCLNLNRMSPTRHKCISFTHVSPRYLGKFPRSSESSSVAPVGTPKSWDRCYPSAMPRTLAHTRICLFRVSL